MAHHAKLLPALAPFLLVAPVTAQAADPARSWTEDATAFYYNAALRLAWERPLGDWVDAEGRRHGEKPYAAARLVREGAHQIDVTDLVRAHGADFRIIGRLADVASRETGAGGPVLIVSRASGRTAIGAAADVAMDSTTHSSRGGQPSHALAQGFFLRFDQPADASIEKAVLQLNVTKIWSGPERRTEIYRSDPRPAPPAMPEVPVGGEAEVVLRVSGQAWKRGQGWAQNAAHARVNPDGSLTAWIAPGSDTALSMIYSIPPAKRRPFMCLRTEMTIHADWTAPMGGKFPGLANTGEGDGAADKAGWGGRGADGTRWSARTNRYGHNAANPYSDRFIGLGTYAYRVNAETDHGDARPFAVAAPKGRRFHYDQCVQLNTPGRADGYVAYWLNGEPAGILPAVVWRSHGGANTLPSEIWANVYEGGTGYDRVPHGPHTVTLHALTLSTKRLP